MHDNYRYQVIGFSSCTMYNVMIMLIITQYVFYDIMTYIAGGKART